ncbi:hypothetical protein M885DRAFT_620697 [Pelagophyceae sp. CCMP2097]|nr:hypothetical protein M885DRAFT_620697 [Pelagophyceae sp. CCMP2097]
MTGVSHAAELHQVNAACLRVGFAAVVVYALATACTFYAFRDKREFLLDEERDVAGLAASALTASLVLRGITRLTAHLSSKACPETKRAPSTPGVVWLAHCVNLVAACTSWIFYFFKVPLLWDPITDCRVHMLRWCEWTVLSFVMTFMTEVADRSDPWSAVRLAATQAGSTACGFLLPLARGPREWGALMTLSCVLYVALFPRLWRRRASCVAAQKRREAARDTLHHADAVDAASRVEMSYALLTCCCIIWTTFVIIYFFASVAKWTGWDSREAPAWPFVCDVVVDLLSKLLYAAVIVDAHSALFDEDAVGARRLRELRGLVAAVWAASSDILAVSVRHRLADGRVRVDTAVSPRADALLAGQKAPCGTVPKPKWPGASDDIPATTITYEEGGPGAAVLAAAAAESSGFAGLVRRAWLVEPVSPAEKSFRMAHELERADGTKLSAEASVTRLGPDRMVVVVRDITERDAGHEAEKKLVKQAAAHERDAAANRFTRHEVKNGLLTTIGLADALQDLRNADRSASDLLALATAAKASWWGPASEKAPAVDDSAGSVITDIQTALTDTLNTVLSESMARELVYDTYVPSPELVDVADLCRGNGGHGSAPVSGSRFRLEAWPAHLPCLVLDPQLLHCIHRNAVSNACKYGASDGEITTRLRLVRSDGTTVSAAALAARDAGGSFRMNLEVVNEPGADHRRLLALDGGAAETRVFAQGARLHAELRCRGAAAAAAFSSGDGGWIMRKCARALGGDCAISFSAEGTVFTASFPVILAAPTTPQPAGGAHFGDEDAVDGAPPPFSLPPGTWGLAIDDSKMQRKLLAKMLTIAGVTDDRVIVTGETGAEIHGYAAAVVDHVRKHAADYHLIIVDENLEVPQPGGSELVLGSECIVELRAALEALGLQGRVLAVVRSANDSPEDVCVYRSRAHGFLPKAPVKRDKVLEALAPIWHGRFPPIESRALP